MITIPQNRRWQQLNSGDVFGSLKSTYNVHFDQEGYVQISPKAVSIYSTADNADFELPLAMFYYGNSFFILTSDTPFTLSSNLTLSEIANASNDISFNSDAISWQGRAYVSTNDALDYWNGSSWTKDVISGKTAGVPHPLEVMSNFSGGSLCYGNGNTVIRLTTAHATAETLTLESDYIVTCIKYFQNELYIGTKSLNGLEAKVFVWDGSTTSAQKAYRVGANVIFALEEYRGGIICVSSEGQILQFSGSGFVPLVNFPVYYSNYRWVDSKSESYRVNKRGIKVDGDIIYINIDGSVTKNDDYFYLEGQPSGVWCYDPKVGLYCRHLSTTDPLLTINVSSLSSSTLTLASSIKAKTGEPVLISDAGSLTGISAYKTYFIIKVSDTEIKLAHTPANAKDGISIDISGSAGSASVKVIAYNNYGYKYANSGGVGAIALIDTELGSNPGDVFNEITPTNIIWGHTYKDGNSYLNALSIGSNIGGFITTKLWSTQAKDAFHKVCVKYSDVNLDNEKIIVKSRSNNVYGLPTEAFDATFSTKRVLGSDSEVFHQAEEGHNIHLLSGNGSGQSVSIDEIQELEIHLDESLENVSSADEVTILIDNFKANGEITESGEYKDIHLGKASSWYQFMVEMRGQKVKIEELQVAQAVKQITR